MAMAFTEKQQKVIDLRDCNILVSAAAGSGKTAVLTERIVNMVSDEEHPVDIDRLLVVTFTNAAAAEMRERIGIKLGERLALNPGSEHLQRQMTLLHNAQITTIDSFCLFLLRNHFHEIGLDPAFRVPDEREIKLLRQEALSELLEDAYEEGKQEFLDAMEALCPKGREKVLEDHILNLSRFAASFPWPEEYLRQRKEDYSASSPEELKAKPFWKYLRHYMTGMILGCAQKLETAIQITHQSDGPYMYGELLEGEKEQLEKLLEKEELEEMASGLDGISFGRLSTKKDDTVSPAKREQAKSIRDEVKKVISDLRTQFLICSAEITIKRGENCAKIAEVLIDLVLDFDRRMREKKQEKKLVDFSDMEHFALNILLKKDGDQIRPSQVALQYRDYFQEVLIDEYQDSNLVQEYILKAVSGEEDGRFDRFMVGDVKQSIYRFRLARPELFLEKYATYREDGPFCKVELAQNFRSRETVIQTVNEVFERMMSEQVGGLHYDDSVALHMGATFPPCKGMESEFLIVEKPGKNDAIEARQAEALAVAARIKKLLQDGMVTDKESKELRKVRYQDIVILLRTLSKWGDVFKEALESQGIPAYVTSKSGYFTATEVQNLLGMLRVIDNPLQDIPLFGVLRSYFGGFSDEEVAKLRGQEKNIPLYEQLCKAAGEGNEKASRFTEKLKGYREMASYLPIRTLLERLVRDYDYLNYVTALPGGTKRRANVEMLFVKASDFEKTSYYGLFHFIRYMEQLEKYEEDYGEADTLDENADVVRIMSIHKSKGLEFPVVFVSGLAKEFNLQDVRQAVILDMDLGIGMDFVDSHKRIKSKTLQKNAIAKKLCEDTLSEELRLFYVALTRAREKLILTAQQDAPEKKYGVEGTMIGMDERLSYLDFMKAESYLDFLNPILGNLSLKPQIILLQDLGNCQQAEQFDFAMAKQALLSHEKTGDPQTKQMLEGRFEFQYPYDALKGLYTKTTVSELKIAAMSEKDEAAFHAFEERETKEYIPAFRRGEEGISGAVRGDAYHRVMELLDFEGILNGFFEEPPADYASYLAAFSLEELDDKVRDFMDSLVGELRLTEEYRDAVSPNRISKFLASELGYRMYLARKHGDLKREQPFVLAIPATLLKEDFPSEEKVLIQGIIDAYFMEKDGIVLLDYKTDSVPNMDMLWQRYETQMDHYQEALERLTGKKVKERILYSFHLGEIGSKKACNF